jgi:DNA-binding transcriptional MerR regulator
MAEEKKMMQIAFSFDEPIEEPIELNEPDTAQELPTVTETAPVNVGLRLKALKEATKPSVILPNPVPTPPIPAKSTPAPIIRTKSTRGRKPLKDSEAEIDAISVPEDEILFQKQYYTIGETAEMFGVNTSLIRFWENEFDILQPRKNRKGDRHFRPVDIKNLLLIHDLLRRRKLTIEGAKDFLKKNKKAQERFEMIESLRKIRSFFSEIKATL